MIRILFMLAVCLSSCSQARVPESTPCKLHPNFNFLNYYMVSCFEEQHFKDEIKAVYDRALKRKQEVYIVDMQLVEKGKSPASMAKSLRKAQRSRDIMAEIFRD